MLPLYSVDLIKVLDEHYPEKCPDIKTSDRQIWFYAGARSVVRSLLEMLKEQEEESLKGFNDVVLDVVTKE